MNKKQTMDSTYLSNGEIEYRRDMPQPTPKIGEVLLRIRLAGICATDFALMQGYANFNGIPGHEFVADVVALGPEVDQTWLGKRVVAEINQHCGHCRFCQRNQPRHCDQRKVIGIRNHPGAFAQYLCVKANTLHQLPQQISDECAVFIEPLAAAFRIIEQLQQIHYDDLLIIGAGRLGQLIARVMATQKKHISIATRHKKQQILLQHLALHCINESDVKVTSFDVVIDASGHPAGLELALNAIRPTGCCILKSSYLSPHKIDLSPLVIKEIRLIGSRCGAFQPAIAALANDSIDPTPLIDATYPLEDVKSAFSNAAEQGAMKILLKP